MLRHVGHIKKRLEFWLSPSDYAQIDREEKGGLSVENFCLPTRYLNYKNKLFQF